MHASFHTQSNSDGSFDSAKEAKRRLAELEAAVAKPVPDQGLVALPESAKTPPPNYTVKGTPSDAPNAESPTVKKVREDRAPDCQQQYHVSFLLLWLYTAGQASTLHDGQG